MHATTFAGLSPAVIDRFGATLSGHIIRPGDPTYGDARLSWNRRFDPRPSLIVRAAGVADVAATVRLAQDHDLPLTIRSGGHSLAGHSSMDDAILLDLGDLRSMDIDAEARLARVGPGLTAGAYSAAAQSHGLATPHGDTASVGIGGLTLGGGIGWLVRKYGLTVDSLVAVELVTADGDIITVDADHEPELFWGLRGGGGNFGIATRFTTRLHPVDRFMGGAIVLPATADVVGEVLSVAADAPEGLTLIPVLMRVPPLPFVSAEHHGSLGFVVLVAWTGSIEAGQRALAPIRAIAPAIGDMVAPMPYPAIYSLTEEATQPAVDVSRSTFLDVLDRSTLAALIDGMAAAPGPAAMLQLRVLGGAMAAVPADATAFAHRAAALMAVIIDPFQDLGEAPVHEAWVSGMYDLVARESTGAYVNFLHREGDDRIAAAYPGATYGRLVELKRRWDPANLFRNNQNIRP